MPDRRSGRVRYRGVQGGWLPADAAPDWLNPPDGAAGPKVDRHALQLCRQVAVTLGQVLAEQQDDALRDLLVEAVEPAPDAAHLLVTVRPAADSRADDLRERLRVAAGRLRAEVAAAITRRKAPTFTFRVAPPGP